MPKTWKYYKTATRKLYEEIDLLEVVKQLRISKFMSLAFLNTNQRDLVKFQRFYCINP